MIDIKHSLGLIISKNMDFHVIGYKKVFKVLLLHENLPIDFLDFLKNLVSLITMVQKLNFYFIGTGLSWPSKMGFLRQVDPCCHVTTRKKSDKYDF